MREKIVLNGRIAELKGLLENLQSDKE